MERKWCRLGGLSSCNSVDTEGPEARAVDLARAASEAGLIERARQVRESPCREPVSTPVEIQWFVCLGGAGFEVAGDAGR